MSMAAALLLVLAAPLLGALLVAVRGTRRVGLALAQGAALPALVLAVAVGPAPRLGVELPWLLLGARLGLDATAWPFFCFTAVLWLAAGLYARGYLAGDARQHRFHALFLMAMAGNLGLIAAGDVATFYLAYAVMSFSTYGLVVHPGGAEAERAARVYIMMVVLSEVLVLSGAVLAVNAAGSTDLGAIAAAVRASPERDVILGLLVAGFGVKAGALGLHMWLPLAHSLAPVPASAVLSGAMIKAGLLGWLRVLPMGGALPRWAEAFLVLGVAGAFFGVLVGVTQRRPKAVLAYSSVSQMGLLMVGVGQVLREAPGPALVALQLYALHHALTKGALFLGVGVAQATSSRSQRGWAMAGLALLAASIAGAPLTSGALAKVALKGAGLGPGLTLLLSVAAAGSTLLMARFLWLVQRQEAGAHAHGGLRLWLPWGLLTVLAAGAAWGLAPAEVVGKALSWGSLWAGLWPVLLGAAGAVLAWHGAARTERSLPEVPMGDLWGPVSWGARRLLAGARALGRAPAPRWPTAGWERPRRRGERWASRLEGALGRWSSLGWGVLVLASLLLGVLAAR